MALLCTCFSSRLRDKCMRITYNGVVRRGQNRERTKTMVFKHGQWMVHTQEGNGGGYNIYNLDPDTGKKRFYEVVPGKFGEPIIIAEPDLAFDAPANLCYINAKFEVVKPDQKIAGIICQDGPRGSLTNLKTQGKPVAVNEDGSLQIGEEKWWLSTLFLKDKNRFCGYDAFCVRERWETVDILELGDLDLF